MPRSNWRIQGSRFSDTPENGGLPSTTVYGWSFSASHVSPMRGSRSVLPRKQLQLARPREAETRRAEPRGQQELSQYDGRQHQFLAAQAREQGVGDVRRPNRPAAACRTGIDRGTRGPPAPDVIEHFQQEHAGAHGRVEHTDERGRVESVAQLVRPRRCSPARLATSRGRPVRPASRNSARSSWSTLRTTYAHDARRRVVHTLPAPRPGVVLAEQSLEEIHRPHDRPRRRRLASGRQTCRRQDLQVLAMWAAAAPTAVPRGRADLGDRHSCRTCSSSGSAWADEPLPRRRCQVAARVQGDGDSGRR